MSRFRIILLLLCCCGTFSVQAGHCVNCKDAKSTLKLCHHFIINNESDTLTNVASVFASNIPVGNVYAFMDKYLAFSIQLSSTAVNVGDNSCISWVQNMKGCDRVWISLMDNSEFDNEIVYAVQQDVTGQLHLYNNIIFQNASVIASTNAVSPDPSNLLQQVTGVFVGYNNFYLPETSPAVNAGENQYVTWSDDIQGLERIACKGAVDQGAFEVHPQDRTITLSATTEENENCSGHTTTIVATGGDRYEWSHSNETSDTVYVNPLIPTCYTVTAYWGIACERWDTATICVNPTEVVENSQGSPSTSGQRFWVSFMKNYSGTSALSLLVSAQNACTGTISNPNTGWSTNFSVSANQTTKISIPNAQAYCGTAGVVGNFGLLVTASDNISLYASNFQAYTYDVTDVLPEPALSTDYVVQTYTPLINSEFMIVATQNGTTVKITPSKTTSDNHPAFVPYTVTLNAGQTYQVLSKVSGINGDLSGSTVQSLDASKPIAVFNGNVCTNVPSGNRWCDHVVEQAFGTHFWGRQFVITNTVGMPYDVVKVTASADNTVLTKNGNYLTTLQANGSYEFHLSANEVACHLEATNACAVYLYVAGGEVNTHDNYRGDPSMVWMSPLEQRIQEITFSTFNSTNITAHYVNVVVPTTSVSSVTCDGVSVSNQFHQVASNPTYSYARLHINNGTHTLNSSQGFVAHVYGTGHCETYAYSCGSKAALLSQQMYVNNVLSTELENNNFCVYEDITFDAAVNYQCDSVVWNFGDSYDNYNGIHFTHHYTEGGTYPVSMTVFMYDSYGQHCTTIYSQVVIHDGDNMVFYDTVCQGETYNAHGFYYLTADPGPVTLTRTVDVPGLDCDSTYVLELLVQQQVNDIYDTICAGNNYSGYGFTLPNAEQGAYLLSDTVQRESCDSITVLHLLVTPNTNDLYGIHGMEYVCPGGVYTYWLDTLSGLTDIVWTMPTGAYILSGQGTDHVEVTFTDDAMDANITATGVNSCGTASFSMTIHPKPIYYVQYTDTVCGTGQPYHRYGFDIDSIEAEHSVFVHNMVSEFCCDSTILLTLIVVELPEARIQSDAYQFCQNDVASLTALCETESIDWNDSLYSAVLNYQWTTGGTSKTITFTADTSTTVGVTITNQYGCSISADTLLTVYPPQTINETLTICENQFPYEWRDTVFAVGTVSGDVVFNRMDSHGCDSTVILHVEVSPLTASEITETVYAQNLPFVLNDSVYTEAGDYVQHLVNQNGCDSTLTLHLIVETALLVVVDSTICEEELPFTWNGVTFTSSGTDTVTLTASIGIDSLVVMNLSVKPMSYSIDTRTACDSLTWINGITYYESTVTPTFTMTAANGCDSVITLHLTINTPAHTATTVTECESYTWTDGNGQTYTTSGEYLYTHPDTNGCQQVDTLHLTINNPVHTGVTVTAYDSYTWTGGNNETYTQSGTYYYAHSDANGCEQVDTLYLTVYYSSSTEFSATACEVFVWDGENYTQSGDYVRTFTDIHGADSTVTMHLIVNYNTYNVETETSCESIEWHGQTCDTTGVYVFEYINDVNCPSVDTLFFTRKYPQAIEFAETACESYAWNDTTYYESGDYIQNFSALNGCDSVVTLHLTILYPTHTSTTVTECESYTWADGSGQTYTTSGEYLYTHPDSNSCVQVDTLHLTINTPTHTATTVVECESYTWTDGNGQTYTTSGEYQYTHPDSNGCQQVDTLHLTINHPVHTGVTVTTYDTYTWTDGNNETYTQSGTYYYTHPDSNGCQQVDTLHLTIYYSSTYEFFATACESYEWDGEIYTQSGDYERLYTDIHGADSTVMLHLTIHYGTHNVVTETSCESFEWHGQTYDTTGVYVFEYTNADSCSSADTLYFTRRYAKTMEFSETACESYNWNDSTYYESGEYTQVFSAVNGCDSVVTLTLTVNHGTHNVETEASCESVEWHGQTCDTTGIYVFEYTNNDDCPSADTLFFTRKYAVSTEFAEIVCVSYTWNDTTYYVSGDYTQIFTAANGCDSVATLHLTINHPTNTSSTVNECVSYTWADGDGQIYTESGDYLYTHPDSNACIQVDTLHLTIIPTTYGTVNLNVVENAMPFLYNDSLYYEAGTYTQYLTNAAGCDSVLVVVLSVYENVTSIADSIVCENDLPISWNGVTFTEAGSQPAVLTAYNGADSVVVMTLTVIPTTYGTFDTTIVENALPLQYNDSTYFEAGTYTQYLTNAAGCDSILSLSLTVYPNVTVAVDSTICEGELPIIWNDSLFAVAGVKTTTIPASTGADSTITMTLAVIPTTYDTFDTAVIENALPYHYNDSTYAGEGTYTQYFTNANGCDSVLTLNLTVYYNVTSEVDSAVCETAFPFTWNDSIFTEAGTKTTMIPAHSGADSTITMTVTMIPTTYDTVELAIVENNLPYQYNDSTYLAAGTYTQYLTNAAGCDSILTLTLTVFYNVTGVDDSTICANELPLTWNGVTFTSAGTQTATLTAASGADSVVTMTLTVNPLSYTTIDTAIIQNNLPFHYINGLIDTTFSVGTPMLSSSQFVFTNANGCDSIVSLNLMIYQNVTSTVDTMVCAANLPFTWHGHTFTAAGSHVATLLTSHGADSVVTYILTVDNIAANINNVTHVTCYGASTGAATATVTGGQNPFTYQWTNATGSTIATSTTINNRPAGTYTFTVTDHLGCSATATTTINALNGELTAGTIASDQELCDGETVAPFTGTVASGGDNGVCQWQISIDGADWTPAPGTNSAQGYTYPNLATVSFSLRRAWMSQSCGTVYSNIVTVSVWPNSSDTLTASVCQGEGFVDYGFDIAPEQTVATGEMVFEQHYTTGHCDSAVILLLTVNPQYETETEDVICEGDGYSANGFEISPLETVGEVEIHRELTLQSGLGCDSVVRLTLTVIDTSLRIVPLTEDFCENMSMELMVVTPMPNYVWSTGESAPTITVTSPGYYSVTATQDVCYVSTQVLVSGCNYELILPNAITPSRGDGLNDWFCIPEFFQSNIALFEISIFNRWGEMVFYSTDKNFKWDGDYKDKTTIQTVYDYVIRYTDTAGRKYFRKGSITVL